MIPEPTVTDLTPTDADRKAAREWANQCGYFGLADGQELADLAELVAVVRAEERERCAGMARAAAVAKLMAGSPSGFHDFDALVFDIEKGA